VQRKIDHCIDALIKELGLNSGRDYGVAVHGNRMVSALVFSSLNMAEHRNPQSHFDSLLAGDVIANFTKTAYLSLKDAVADRYGNAMIPTLFKNLSKCRELFDACNKQEHKQLAIPLPEPAVEQSEESEEPPQAAATS
jgi:hypothetical protein